MPCCRCTVFGCNNNKLKVDRLGLDIVFHNFPHARDQRSNQVLAEWIRCCQRIDPFNPKTSQICSIHFKPDDYERDLRNEVLGLPSRKMLKKWAVPSQYLPSSAKDGIIIKDDIIKTTTLVL